MRIISFVATLVAVPFLFSCVNTSKATYFNNIPEKEMDIAAQNLEPVIQKGDLLSITVSSMNPEATIIYNQPNISGGTASGTNGAPVNTSGYLVSQDGSIQFPVLGTIQVAGLSKKGLKDELTKQLVDKKLLVDPNVSVRYMNFRVTVLGEVARPTVVTVPSEQITLLEALGMAGDLTIYAKRDNVLLIRDEGGKRITKRLNLNSDDLLSSPYYFLKPNDVIYAEPNKSKITSTSQSRQILPIVMSGLSFAAIIIDRLISN